ncbi:putative multidrug resistance ABC transporter ATP-binding/permease protein YheI [Austwickia sp. TVS 96-490-7B]|uniref:ABC transporter ATP-binding protein n=1 Tax=Austwickia sp. TVS 96-490-7B TaxID=2830843 RepID=UPI001C598D99|nr:ABC transporter ATP-binding protein [Austwickia sp. TVS 96-490-7B]MBW3084748.1 putative multidrug resistance ABC transporter ATP-binding/permease protein YheI [Austwickia sp. TVS 96-490-7B]
MPRIPYDDPGTPDLRSPLRYLIWVGRGQWRLLVAVMITGAAWMVALSLIPAAIGRAVDAGRTGGSGSALVQWSAAVVALGVVSALTEWARHRYAVLNWLTASLRTIQLLGRHAVHTGGALPRQIPTGEVMACTSSDALRIGAVFDVAGRFAGAVLSYIVVSVILLSASPLMGAVVLIGVPVMGAVVALVLRPLQRRQAAQREQTGRLVALGADTVAGLRVLRGIGGEAEFLHRYRLQSGRVLDHGIRVAGLQALLDAVHVLLPGLFVVVTAWLGARSVVEGAITPGEAVQFYGYAAFLSIPLHTMTEGADRAVRSLVAARQVITVLQVNPDQQDSGQMTTPVRPPVGPQQWLDPVSGVAVSAGTFLAVACPDPAVSTAMAERLTRVGPGHCQTLLGDNALADLPLAQVRSRVILGDNEAHLFSGSLRDQLDPRSRWDDDAVRTALYAADALDVLDGLPEGLDTHVEERGRSLSGGQRQRLALARALLTDADHLVLVEPTSAVDAHTEARIAPRLRTHRHGRSTVIASVSPLLLDAADDVVLLDRQGHVVSRGHHRHLLDHCPSYRSCVLREETD